MIKGIRNAPDGSFWHPNPSSQVIQEMDRMYQRVKGEYRWVPRDIKTRDYHTLILTRKVYVIGCGESIDRLTAQSFERDCNIICCNQSLHTIEKIFPSCYNGTALIYGLQMDGIDCIGKSPRILEDHIKYLYPENKVYTFHQEGLNPYPHFTPEAATIIARDHDVKKIIFYGLDAQMNGNLHYAQSVASQSGRSKKVLDEQNAYTRQAYTIKKIANGDMDIVFKMPAAPNIPSGEIVINTASPSSSSHNIGKGVKRAIIVHPSFTVGTVGPTMLSIKQGLERLEYQVENSVRPIDSNKYDLAVIWNGYRAYGRECKARFQNTPCLICEHGFISRSDYTQCDPVGFLHNSSWAAMDEPAPIGSLDKLNTLVPTRCKVTSSGRGEGNILILGQVDGDTQLLQSDPKKMDDLIKLVSRALHIVSSGKLKAVYRPHPQRCEHPIRLPPNITQSQYCKQGSQEAREYRLSKQGTSLAQELDDARFCIAINSNALIEATIAGVPCMAFGPSLGIAANAYKRTSIETLENDLRIMINGWEPNDVDVEYYLRMLVGHQYSKEEFASGTILESLIQKSISRQKEQA